MTSRIATETDASAFEALLAAHRGIVLKVAASYSRTADERSDLAQEIALQLWRGWPQYDPERRFSTWMYRVALNVAISHQRDARRRREHEPLDPAHDGLVGDRDVDAETRERQAIVQRAMAALGSLDRALLLLHLEGCSHREAAEVFGTTEGNVATRLGRIRQHLRRIAGTTPEGDADGTA